MRLARLADIHLKGKDLPDVVKQLDAVVDIAKDNRFDAAVIAGDIFHSSNVGDGSAVTGEVADAALGFITRLLSVVEDILMIPGNHDIPGVGSMDALTMFDRLRGVRVVRKVDRIDWKSLKVACLPWSWDSKINPMALGLEEEPVDLLLGHAQVVGGTYGGAECPEKVGSWQVTQEWLKAFPARSIAFGDFHRRQPFYVGALRQEGHSNEGDPTGFEVWDTVTNLVEWVDVNIAPRYMTIVIDPEAEFDGRLPEFPTEGFKCRLKIPSNLITQGLRAEARAAGVSIYRIAVREERVTRADVQAGVVENKHALMQMYGDAMVWPQTRTDAMAGAFAKLVKEGAAA